ncbi:MAG: hypothetical protein EXR45_00345 [Chloroflexi bacterium]|nr:hypothetical protein [Chloroflexota bacterium]
MSYASQQISPSVDGLTKTRDWGRRGMADETLAPPPTNGEPRNGTGNHPQLPNPTMGEWGGNGRHSRAGRRQRSASTGRGLRASRSTATSLPAIDHADALDELRFIRNTMEAAGSFTSVPGWATAWIGASALVTAMVASGQPTSDRWLAAWLIEATLAGVVGVLAVARKARRTGLAVTAGPNRRFASSFTPPMVSGAILTAVLWWHGLTAFLPGTWLLAFGTGVTAGGASSVRAVRVLGITLMALGALAFVVPQSWGDAILAVGFGGLLAGFGVVIARRHGG